MDRRTLLAIAALGPGAAALASAPAGSLDVRTPRCVAQWGGKGAEPGQFDSPIGVAISRRDEIYVTDYHNGRVQQFDTTGKLVRTFPTEPEPGGIAIDRAGRVYVGHFGYKSGRACVVVFTPDGKRLHDWGKTGTGDGEFDSTGGIAIAADGSLYIADQTNRRVQKFAPDGRFLLKWGRYGSAPGQFDGVENPKSRTGGPQFVAIDKQGYVRTTEARIGRIQRFTPDGRFDLCWGSNRTDPGGFGGRPKNLPGPIALCFDRGGNLWISSTNNRVQQFTPRGEYLRGIAETGEAPGQFHTPHGVAFDSRGRLYVVDSGNQRVQKFVV